MCALFDELRVLQSEYTVRISFLELYNEELYDLLSADEVPPKLRSVSGFYRSICEVNVILTILLVSSVLILLLCFFFLFELADFLMIQQRKDQW